MANDRTLKIWNAVTGQCERTLDDDGLLIRAARFNDDGTKIIYTDDDVLIISDTATGEVEQTLPAGSRVYSLAVNHDSSLIAAASSGSLSIWSQ
jgi:WD40 repeat protein